MFAVMLHCSVRFSSSFLLFSSFSTSISTQPGKQRPVAMHCKHRSKEGLLQSPCLHYNPTTRSYIQSLDFSAVEPIRIKPAKLHCFHPSPLGGHSILMWTRLERGSKMSVLIHAQGIITVHLEGGGGKKMAKFGPRSCWITPNSLKGDLWKVKPGKQVNHHQVVGATCSRGANLIRRS